MFKKISGLGQGHRYLTDEELLSALIDKLRAAVVGS